MLASLLPGLRDVRTPLAVGYIWVLNFWLVLGDTVSKDLQGSHGLGARLVALSQFGGQGPTIAAISFAAFLLGSFFTVRPDSSSLIWAKVARRNSLGNKAELIEHVAGTLNIKGMETAKSIVMPGDQTDDLLFPMDDFRARLLAANQEMYGEFDRLESEAVFRINISVPLFALGVIAIYESSSPSWLKFILALIVTFLIGVFFAQGQAKAGLADKVLARSVTSGIIEHPLVEKAVAIHAALQQQWHEQEIAEKHSSAQRALRKDALSQLFSLHKQLRRIEVSHVKPGAAAREAEDKFKERQEAFRRMITEQESRLMELWDAS